MKLYKRHYYLFFVIVKGIVILAPESLPNTVIVVLMLVSDVPNKTSTVVPTIVKEVPTKDLLI